MRIRRRRHGERGTALMEAAITAPIFLLVVFAVFEFGLAFRAYLSVSASTRDSTRAATVMGDDPLTDYEILQTVKRTLKRVDPANIQAIVVFKATGPQSTTGSGALASCRTSSVNNLCNRYVGSDLSRPSSQFGCTGSSPDRFWCPTNRKTAVSGPPDFIGIYIRISHKGPTVLANMTKTIDDEVVMRLEPQKLA